MCLLITQFRRLIPPPHNMTSILHPDKPPIRVTSYQIILDNIPVELSDTNVRTSINTVSTSQHII